MKPHPNDIRRDQDRILDIVADRLQAELVAEAELVRVSRLDARRGWVRSRAGRLLHGKGEREQ